MSGKILVTGASGFVGRHICKRLESLNYDFIALSSSDGDISDGKMFNAYENCKIEHVIHLAGLTFVPKSWEAPSEFMKVNVHGTTEVLEFCRKEKCSITYISAYVYGSEIVNPIREDGPVKPNNPYAFSKKLGEEVCEFYSQFMNVTVNIVRPFNIYGPGQGAHFLIPFIIGQVIEGKEVRVKDLNPKRDYIYIDDLVECIIKLIDYKKFGIFNAGSGRSYSVKEVIDLTMKAAGKKLPVLSEAEERKNEISDTVASISLAASELKWVPTTSLEEGLSKIYNHIIAKQN